MDVFKLAFETIIVGLLGSVWISVMAFLLSPHDVSQFFTHRLPPLAKDYQYVTGLVVLTLAYCLGSAILPISRQLVNDEHLPVNESAIRCEVFLKQQDLQGIEGLTPQFPSKPRCSYWAPFAGAGISLPIRIRNLAFLLLGHTTEETQRENEKQELEKLLTDFQRRENSALNQNSQMAERLRQLNERIVVLRGALLSFYVLFLTCLFASVDRVRRRVGTYEVPIWGFLLTIGCLLFAATNGYQDLKSSNIVDLPVFEGLIVLISAFGGYLMFRGVKTKQFLSSRFLLTIAFFVVLAYGGWMHSEIDYDQQVMISYAFLQPAKP